VDDQAILELRIAGRPGPSFSLDRSTDTILGRSTDAVIALPDRLASRNHAALRYDAAGGSWIVQDLGSRNGTWLDGERITSGTLRDGSVIRLGTSELIFRLLAPESRAPAGEAGRLLRCGPVGQFAATALRRSASGAPEDPRWPLLLYQAGIRLLVARSLRDVIATTLELAAEHCGAASFGWFRTAPHASGPASHSPVPAAAGPNGAALEPVCVIPPGSQLYGLVGDAATRLILADKKAVWLAAGGQQQPAGPHQPCDVICVPLVEHDRVHAMLAAAAPAGGLRDADFDFLVALASLAAAACAGRDPAAADEDDDQRDDSSLREAIAMLATISIDEVRAAQGGTGLPSGRTFVLDAAAAAALDPQGDRPAAAVRISSFVAESATLRLEDWQRVLVIEALRRCGGSVPNAAAELGISRATLYRKLETYGLARSRG